MAQELIVRGLELFAAGDIAGATRLWLEAQKSQPHDPQLVAYLEHVRSAAPEILAAVEADQSGAWESAAALAPPLPPPAQRAAGQPDTSPAPEAATLSPPASANDAVALPDPWSPAAPDVQPLEVQSSAAGLALLDATAPKPAAAPPQLDIATLERRLAELTELDDFSGALEVAQQMLLIAPEHGVAQQAMRHCRAQLEKIYQSKLGDTRAVPTVRLPPGEVIWLDLDHRAGFVLAQVDGVSSYEDIIEVTGMDRLESLRILAQLVQSGVIGVA